MMNQSDDKWKVIPYPKNLEFDHFQKVLKDAADTVLRGEREGRNSVVPFWNTFPHGLQDLTFMVYDKSTRIVGAEQFYDRETIRDNALDIINYCAFILMWLDRQEGKWPRPTSR